MDTYFDTVLSIANPKPAALFYESVIPIVPSPDMLAWIVPPWGVDDHSGARKRRQQIFSGLLSDQLLKDRSFREDFTKVHYAFSVVMRDTLRLGTEGDEVETPEAREAFRLLEEFLHRYGLLDSPLDVPQEMISNDCDAGSSEVCITLAFENLIKTEVTSWDQILEFRRDKTAKEKLRRFRLFADVNYRGKSKAYVEDDILRRLDDYESTVKQWGFETAEGAFNILASSKTLAGTGAGALISALAGAPFDCHVVGRRRHGNRAGACRDLSWQTAVCIAANVERKSRFLS
jgi:hypothetical protein